MIDNLRCPILCPALSLGAAVSPTRWMFIGRPNFNRVNTRACTKNLQLQGTVSRGTHYRIVYQTYFRIINMKISSVVSPGSQEARLTMALELSCSVAPTQRSCLACDCCRTTHKKRANTPALITLLCTTFLNFLRSRKNFGPYCTSLRVVLR